MATDNKGSKTAVDGDNKSGLWAETMKLQNQIQNNFETTNQLLARANMLKTRLAQQRLEHRKALAQLDQRLLPADSPSRLSGASSGFPSPASSATASPMPPRTLGGQAAGTPSNGAPAGNNAVTPVVIATPATPTGHATEAAPAPVPKATSEPAVSKTTENTAPKKDGPSDAEVAWMQKFQAEEKAKVELMRLVDDLGQQLQERQREYEAGLELIMERYRDEQHKHQEEMAQAEALREENSALRQKMAEMVGVIRDHVENEQQEALDDDRYTRQLETENQQLRDLIDEYQRMAPITGEAAEVAAAS